MKKILSLLAAALLTATAIQAQEPTDSIAILKNQIDSIQIEKDNLSKTLKWQSIWSNNKYTMISYAPSTDVTVDGAYKEDAKFSFALTKGNTYYLHSKPIGGILKIGLDLRWFDLQATKYEKIDYETSDNWQDSPSFGDEDDDEILEMLDDIGRWDLHIGMGIGPTVTVAPFSMFDNASKHIRLSFYGHYQPSFGINLISQDGDVESSTAFCNMYNYGGKLVYRRISLGIEKQWGEGKYKQLTIFNDDEEDDNSPIPSIKHKRKFSSLRFYVAFSF